MAASNKVIITCAVTGAIHTPSMSPYLPVTPQEMFDLWQKMVNPSAYPLQSFMFPVLDPKELE